MVRRVGVSGKVTFEQRLELYEAPAMKQSIIEESQVLR